MTSPGAAPLDDHALDDHALARDLATQAGELLLGLRSSLLAGLDPRAAGRAADSAAQDLLAQALDQHRPGDAVLSEEAADDDVRLGAGRVWIIDPLDGTREYSSAGRSDWAVHVALCEDGDLVAGAVALPVEGRTLGTDEPVGDLPAPPGGATAPWRFVVSRSRPPAVLDHPAFRAALGDQEIDVRPHGSAGAKTAEVVLGRADVYLHASSADGSGLNQWDAAAPAAVAAAAGLHVSHLDGSPLRFNVANVVTGDFLVCRPEIAAPLLAALAAARS